MFWKRKDNNLEKRLESAMKAIKELQSMPAEKVNVYHEVTRYNDTDVNHIRELASIGANEHFRSFLYFEREKIVSRLEGLAVDEKESMASLCGALKELSIIVREFENKIMQHAEISGRS
jgi:hypothetical protein